MKRITFFIIVLFSVSAWAQSEVTDISWDKDKKVLSYTLSRDSVVRIRAGSSAGPLYATVLNCQKRAAGRHQEHWDGRDPKTGVDFTAYGELAFSIDTGKDLSQDADLRFTPEFNGNKLILVVDIDKKDRRLFYDKQVKLKAFMDNRLIKLVSPKSFPYTLELNLNKEEAGLVMINVWSPEYKAMAYASLVVDKQKPRSKGKIVFCRRGQGYWQVFIAGLDGRDQYQLTKSAVDKRNPAISPDGKKIAYATNTGELWVMDINGENKRKLKIPVMASGPCWSMDNKRIAFTGLQDLYHGDTDLWELDLSVNKAKKLLSRPWLQYAPNYSSGGQNIIFVDGQELFNQEIRQLDFKTGDIRQLTDNSPKVYDIGPFYSPDGERIYYSSNEDGNYDIWVMDKFGASPKNLTSNPAHDIGPHPIEGAVYFLSDRGGQTQVWRMELDGTRPRQVTTGADKQDLAVYYGQ